MGTKTREVGGGPATGLADQLVQWLSQGLNTGTFGAGTAAGTDAYGSTMGISGYLNDILAGGAGRVGGATQQMIQTQADRDAAALRARFGAGGGTAFGTGAQYAEGVLRSETAPKLISAIGNQQQNALQMLLPLFGSLAGKGISQRQMVAEPSGWAQAAGIAAPLLAAGLNFMAPGAGTAVGAGMGAIGGGRSITDMIGYTPSGGGGGPQWQLPPVPALPWMTS